MKKILAILRLMIFFLMMNAPLLLLAQDVEEDADAGAPIFTNDVQDAPIDGGVSLLVAAAVGYGLKKAHNSRKKKQQEDTICK